MINVVIYCFLYFDVCDNVGVILIEFMKDVEYISMLLFFINWYFCC